MKNQITCLLWTTAILINSTLYAQSSDLQEQAIETNSVHGITQENTLKEHPINYQEETNTLQQEQEPYTEQEITTPAEIEPNPTQPSTETFKSGIEQETATTINLSSENPEITPNKEASSSTFADQQPTEQPFQTSKEKPEYETQQNNIHDGYAIKELTNTTENTTASIQTYKRAAPHQDISSTQTIQTKPKQNMIIDASPWEKFLIQTITVIRHVQMEIQSYSNLIFSKQGIPLLIIMFGLLLLSTVLWFAYSSFKQEQTSKINNLVKNKQGIKNQNKPQPLSVAYAEEESGDYDIFATSEGVPIKLDLAQAYINMQDVEGAKTILQDIIKQHRGKTVTQAQEMLRKINLAT
ncbi:MAG: FimV/HubP family polar landmark protein [Pseudomonadota bacterium]|nr:FimV/HubP family polar landmark protein [Pseudomonadota bacterium]